jgi:hypothetical protein
MSNPLDAASWDVCNKHEISFLRDLGCIDCIIESLTADVERLEATIARVEDEVKQYNCSCGLGGLIMKALEVCNE